MTKIRRLVLNFPGFETTSSIHQIERLSAGGRKTADLWGFELSTGKTTESADGQKAETSFAGIGNGWSTQIHYVHFSWADIIEK